MFVIIVVSGVILPACASEQGISNGRHHDHNLIDLVVYIPELLFHHIHRNQIVATIDI